MGVIQLGWVKGQHIVVVIALTLIACLQGRAESRRLVTVSSISPASSPCGSSTERSDSVSSVTSQSLGVEMPVRMEEIPLTEGQTERTVDLMEALSVLAWGRRDTAFSAWLIEDLQAVPSWRLECTVYLSDEEGGILLRELMEPVIAPRVESPDWEVGSGGEDVFVF